MKRTVVNTPLGMFARTTNSTHGYTHVVVVKYGQRLSNMRAELRATVRQLMQQDGCTPPPKRAEPEYVAVSWCRSLDLAMLARKSLQANKDYSDVRIFTIPGGKEVIATPEGHLHSA